jgi:linoleoyl-CoA desaturase
MSNQHHIYCIHDRLYNVADFVSKHPGGTNVFANLKPLTDITPMIYTYHKDASLIFDVLKNYDISANNMSLVTYKTDYNYDRYKELKVLVYDEIRRKGLPLYWSTAEILYNMGGFAAYLGIWGHCFTLAADNPVSSWWFVLLAIINIGHCALLFHETSHYTGFKNQLLNTLISHIAVAPVLTTEEWKWDHNYLHHGFTNTDFDSDFNGHQLAFRHSSEHPHYFQHRFQHLYAGVLMCLGGFSGQIDSIKHDRWNIFLFFGILYWFGFYNTLVFYSLTGFLFLLTAQLSHIQPECVNKGEHLRVKGEHLRVKGEHLRVKGEHLRVKGEHLPNFLVNQVASTINYRTDNIVARYMCFGLDIQIEHHLFPNIPHSTLRQVQYVVRHYCLNNNVPYIERSDVIEMAKSYWWHLYKMGAKTK